MSESLSLWGLFLSAFLSSTVLPGSSEAVLGALAVHGQSSGWTLLAVATFGNTLGGMSSWAVGWLIGWRYPSVRAVPHIQQVAVDRLRRWGSPILLLSWMPVIGDPLCVAAGWLRMPWRLSMVCIGLGKGLRYVGVLGLASMGTGE